MCEPRSRSLSRLRPSCRKTSLNKENRWRELVRITEANQALFKRLKCSQPVVLKSREVKLRDSGNFFSKKRSRSSLGCRRSFQNVKRNLVLGGRQMVCEVEENSNGVLLTLNDHERNEKYELLLPHEEFQHIKSYDRLFEMISLENDQIILTY